MTIESIATTLFAVAVCHTFCVAKFRSIAHHYPEGSKGENLFHLLGETEAVFLLWAGTLFAAMTAYYGWHHHHATSDATGTLEALQHGWHEAIHYIEGLNYNEPKFVFMIMVIAATKPIITMVDNLIRLVARCVPLPAAAAFLLSAMTVGPLLGSFITEPAAMTVTALVLKRQFFDRGISMRFKYMLIGTLFVSVSIGGTLTHFAAPPVLMVAGTWEWDTTHMIRHFGWKAALAAFLSSCMLVIFFFAQLKSLGVLQDSRNHGKNATEMQNAPWWVTTVHLVTLGLTVLTSHHPDVCMGIFVFFLGFCIVTQEYQETLKIKESLLVGGFLAGLVTLGGLQRWWLEPLLASLGELPLYLGTAGLTAITDNAALTYLGSQVEGLSEGMKYALVAGAVSGGGLTVIANAPNPAGYSILNPSFENGSGGGISPLWLLLGATPATLIAMSCLWLLPSL